MYHRELEKCKVQSLARSGGNFDWKAYVSEEAAKELKQQIRNIFDAFAPIKSPPVDLTIFPHESLEVWEGTEQVTEIGGRWNCMKNECHINSLELQAAFFFLKAFCKNKTRLHLLLKLDNTTAVSYINQKGRGWGGGGGEAFQHLVTNQQKSFGTGPKGKIFGSLHPMYLGLEILLISGHIFFMITKSDQRRGLPSPFLINL